MGSPSRSHWGHRAGEEADAPPSIRGDAFRFELPTALRSRSTGEVLRALHHGEYDNPEERLAELIEAAAATLPLPDACAVIRTPHAQPPSWASPLASLAVFAKASDAIWLRRLRPRLSGLLRDGDIVVLVPPGGRLTDEEKGL
ncbi:MAG: hypothetical protein ACKVH0_01010 [Alphaproteobacteria bacterium]